MYEVEIYARYNKYIESNKKIVLLQWMLEIVYIKLSKLSIHLVHNDQRSSSTQSLCLSVCLKVRVF